MSGRTVVLTGGTAGIGAALAIQLRKQGDRVVVIGRRATGVDSLSVDLRREDAAVQLESGLQGLGIANWDLLIHNAGVGWVGPIPEQSSASIRDVLNVNLWAPIEIIRRRLSSASPNARVIFISSPVAHLPSPDFAVYASSKAGLEAFARAIRAERIGVEIQVLRPCATATELLSDLDAARLGLSKGRFAPPDVVATKLMKRINGPPRWSSCDVLGKTAVGIDRLGLAAWLRRRPRIDWPSFAFSGEPEAQSRDAGPQAIVPRLRLGLRSAGTPHPSRQALVTGAADGIGRALAVQFSHLGFEIVGIDCDEAKLSDAALEIQQSGGRLHSLVADLSESASLERLIETLHELGPFDVVIHNAGINRFGRFTQSDLAEQRRVFDVNLIAPILLTQQLFAMGLIAEGCRLGFVSSLSHFVGYPGSAVYAATKSALASFAASLAACGPSIGFSVTTVFPGPTPNPPGAGEQP